MSRSRHRSSRGWRRGRRTALPNGGQPDRRRLRFEALEDRRLLAVFSVDNLNDAGPGSLRAAILQANAAMGADEIVFTGAGASGVISLTSGELLVTDSLTIAGPGRDELTIASQGIGRIINFTAVGGAESSDDLALSGLTLRDGLVSLLNPLDGGGAVRFLSSGELTIDACRLMNNRIASALATDDPSGGGAVFTSAGTITVSNSTVQGNSATGTFLRVAGGGIYADSGAIVIIESRLLDNMATGGRGGAIATSSGTLSLTDSVVNGNTAGDGGGISTQSGQLILLRSELSANVAGNNGGGVYAEGGDITMTQCLMAANIAEWAGGMEHQGGSLSLESCVVSANIGWTGTGGIYWSGYDVPAARFLMDNSQVIGNRGGWVFGGGGLGLAGDATVSHSIVSANSVHWDGSPYGGGIYHSLGTLIVSDSEITNNVGVSNSGPGGAPHGGGIAARGTETVILRSLVRGNDFEWVSGSPAKSGYGAGIYADPSTGGSSILTIRESEVSGNHIANDSHVARGGGIYASSFVNLRVFDSAISGNAAQSQGGNAQGGGIFAPRLTLVNSTVSGNMTNGDGGGLFLNEIAVGSKALLVNSTLTGNVAAKGGGVYVDGDSKLTLANVIVADNSATTGPDVSIPLTTITGVNNSLIGDTAGSKITAVSGTGNVLGQPAALGPLQDNGGPTPTHALLPGSLAVDAGRVLDSALYDYRLDGTLADANGAGGDLTPQQGGMLKDDYFRFNTSQGLTGQIPASEAEDYSLEFWLKLDNVEANMGYRKLVDFSTGANLQAGLYVFNDRLRYVVNTTTGFYTGTQPLFENTWHHVVLTRSVDTSGGSPVVEIKTYVDGLFDKSYPESFMGHALAVFSQQGATADARLVKMFQTGNGVGEVGAGAVDRIRFYDHALLQADVANVYATSLLNDFDQRGTPFARRAGEGVDIGPYELQSATAADFNSDGNVDGDDFLAWQRGLGKPNALRSDGDGDGDGDVDAADLADWRATFGQVDATPAAAAITATKESESLAGVTSAAHAELVDAAMALADLTLATLALNVEESEAPRPVKPALPPVFVEDRHASSLAYSVAVTKIDDVALHESRQETSTDELAWLSEKLVAAVFS